MKNKNLIVVSLFFLLPVLVQSQNRPSSKAPARPEYVGSAAPKTGRSHLPPGIPASQAPLKTGFALRYQELVVGTGPEAQPGQIYRVHYTGWMEADGRKFDSSVDRDEPVEFTQGMRQVIAGWDEGFEGMRVGGKRRLFVPYQLAYGAFGFEDIPPKANLIFDVQLLEARGMPMPAPRQNAPYGTIPAAPPQPPMPQAPAAPPQPPDPMQPL